MKLRIFKLGLKFWFLCFAFNVFLGIGDIVENKVNKIFVYMELTFYFSKIENNMNGG